MRGSFTGSLVSCALLRAVRHVSPRKNVRLDLVAKYHTLCVREKEERCRNAYTNLQRKYTPTDASGNHTRYVLPAGQREATANTSIFVCCHQSHTRRTHHIAQHHVQRTLALADSFPTAVLVVGCCCERTTHTNPSLVMKTNHTEQEQARETRLYFCVAATAPSYYYTTNGSITLWKESTQTYAKKHPNPAISPCITTLTTLAKIRRERAALSRLVPSSSSTSVAATVTLCSSASICRWRPRSPVSMEPELVKPCEPSSAVAATLAKLRGMASG